MTRRRAARSHRRGRPASCRAAAPVSRAGCRGSRPGFDPPRARPVDRESPTPTAISHRGPPTRRPSIPAARPTRQRCSVHGPRTPSRPARRANAARRTPEPARRRDPTIGCHRSDRRAAWPRLPPKARSRPRRPPRTAPVHCLPATRTPPGAHRVADPAARPTDPASPRTVGASRHTRVPSPTERRRPVRSDTLTPARPDTRAGLTCRHPARHARPAPNSDLPRCAAVASPAAHIRGAGRGATASTSPAAVLRVGPETADPPSTTSTPTSGPPAPAGSRDSTRDSTRQSPGRDLAGGIGSCRYGHITQAGTPPIEADAAPGTPTEGR